MMYGGGKVRPCRISVSQGLDRVREVARLRKKEKFTALAPRQCRGPEGAYMALKRRAASGVDGLTWQDEGG